MPEALSAGHRQTKAAGHSEGGGEGSNQRQSKSKTGNRGQGKDEAERREEIIRCRLLSEIRMGEKNSAIKHQKDRGSFVPVFRS
mgnify:CR=1 FL=1